VKQSDKPERVTELRLRPAQKRNMPRDPNQRAKLAVDMLYGEAGPLPEPTKDPERVERGRKGGSKGGKLRADKLTPERRREIAQQAARARWGPTQD
jgi:hypothetical protein